MAKIVDPDQLNQATEVVINTTAKTIQLLVAGNLSDSSPGASSGATGQAVYSFIKEEWKTDNALNKFRFPLKMYTKTDGQLLSGWDWADAQTRELLRDFGWTEVVAADQYPCIISLGAFNAVGDQAYYAQVTGYDQTTATFTKTGELNEAILGFDDGGSDFTGYLKVYLREQGKIYDEYNLLTEQNLSVLEPVLYRLPLSNSVDLKIVESDANILILEPYISMAIDYLSGTLFVTATVTSYSLDEVVQDTAGRWAICTTAGTLDAAGVAAYGSNGGTAVFAAYAGERLIGTNYYAYNRIVDGGTGTAQKIYEYIQHQLRLTTDINDNTLLDAYGTIFGNVAALLAGYTGDQFQTKGGVYVDNFDINDQNSMSFFDITVDGGGVIDGLPVITTERVFPFVSTFNIIPSQNLVDEPDVDTRLTMYFKNDDAGDNTGRDFDTATAIIVNDNGGTPIDFTITSGSIAGDYDYDNNDQRGVASKGVDAPIVIVAQGLNGAEWVAAEFTITRAAGQTFAVNANDERSFANPV